TVDALHTQREHVTELAARGAHWVLSVKGNQPRLRRQLAALPWREVEIVHRSSGTAHGRREIRTLKVVTIAAGIEFPHAAQAIQVTRRTRPIPARTGRRGRWRTETVYAITLRSAADGRIWTHAAVSSQVSASRWVRNRRKYWTHVRLVFERLSCG